MNPFLSVAELRELPSGRPVVLADCRWYLDGRSGADAYAGGHLPGAVFVDLDELADAPGVRGRHPLPDPTAFARVLARHGISRDHVVVAYDDAGGVIAARLVWMLRVIGIDAAVLDGGIGAWDGELSTEHVDPPVVDVMPVPWPDELLADVDTATRSDVLLLDARPPARFAGEEPDVDPRLGHIPGAVNVPCRESLASDGRLLAPDVLARRFRDAGVTLDRVSAGEVVSSCGSGVTACHNLLVMESLGLGRARLYPGSWSEYAATDRPLAVGR